MTFFQIVNFLILIAAMLFVLYQTVKKRRAVIFLMSEAVAILVVAALCWLVSPNTLLSGIAALQLHYVFEMVMVQKLKFAVQRGLGHFVFEGLVLICTGAQVVLLSQATVGWVEVLCWILLIATLIIAAIDPIKRANALHKEAHWLKR